MTYFLIIVNVSIYTVTNITNPTCLACVLPNKGGVTVVKVSRPCSSQPVLNSIFTVISMTAGAEFLELMVFVADLLFSRWPQCGVCLQVLTQTQPAAARTCSVVSGHAVALESDPTRPPTPRNCHVYLFLHFILEMPVAVFCSIKEKKKSLEGIKFAPAVSNLVCVN